TYLSFLRLIQGLFINPEVVQQVQHLVQGSAPVDLATASEPVRQTWLILQKYHPAMLASQSVGREEIEMACLLGNAVFSKYILAISIGSVFFGALTYIGNAPNFMVKAIADHQKIHTPTFLGYVFRYAAPFLAPILLVIWWIFFRV